MLERGHGLGLDREDAAAAASISVRGFAVAGIIGRRSAGLWHRMIPARHTVDGLRGMPRAALESRSRIPPEACMHDAPMKSSR